MWTGRLFHLYWRSLQAAAAAAAAAADDNAGGDVVVVDDDDGGGHDGDRDDCHVDLYEEKHKMFMMMKKVMVRLFICCAI